ncbi:MAG: hypothetical protein M1113_01890 [Candidatus Thermoplasmatota archaeon]|jgi:hypothetical protein|nr:hypothetical protein [Candidatus Thermoplasmatota archaeon]
MAGHIRLKNGTMQDASFIESDHGECGKPRGKYVTKKINSASLEARIIAEELNLMSKA